VRHWLRCNVCQLAIAALALWFFSHLLSRLSGTALWVPKEWRLIVRIIGTAIGMAVFSYVRHRHATAITAAASESSESHSGHRRRRGRRPSHEPEHQYFRWGISWMAACIGLVICYMLLRGYCVYPWDARDWLRGEAAVAAEAPATEPEHAGVREKHFIVHAEATHATPAAENHLVVHAETGQIALAAAHDGTQDEEAAADVPRLPDGSPLPEFIDIARGEIFLPLWLKPDQRQYVRDVAAANTEDGLTHILNEEPDRVIDWVRGDGLAHEVTTSVFFLLHLAIVISVGAAAACFFEPLEAGLHATGLVG
jgi:hypothetical protein